MMPRLWNRRRFISLSAATGVLALCPNVAPAQQTRLLRKWHGAAMGAKAVIRLYGADEKQAAETFQHCQREIDRLENIFSLYRPRSAVSRLNDQGNLDNPPLELLDVMSRCQACWENSDGAFDMTIQPLWQLYADHFAGRGASPSGPSDDVLRHVLDFVGTDKVRLGSRRISFAKPGMGISLNGVAQGYITDRVVAVLKEAGYENCLVHMGETYGLGQHEDGRSWSAGLSSPIKGRDILSAVPLHNQALATSGGYGSPFGGQGRLHHLLDPRTGRSANHYGSVSVVATDTMTADMLSTALYVMAPDKGKAIWAHYPQLSTAYFVDQKGQITTVTG